MADEIKKENSEQAEVKKSNFVHLHMHSEYSLLDGGAKIGGIIKECQKQGMPAVAITDHGNMFGAIKFYTSAIKAGIKPIVGCEFYATDDITKKAGSEMDHLVLLAKNHKGYLNLAQLNSIAYVDGFYKKPRIAYSMLKDHAEGVICLSACIAGRLPKLLLNGQAEKAKNFALSLKEIFKDDFYIEIQDHGIPEERECLPLLVSLANEIGVKLVATNDAHYVTKEDALMHDVLLCIQTKAKYDDPNRMRFSSDDFYMKSEEEMLAIFPYAPESITNTLEIADKVQTDIFAMEKGELVKDKSLIPGYIPPDGSTPYDYLKNLLDEGLIRRYGTVTPEIRERADYEFGVISSMGFVEYYLIVWDFIKFAKDHGIPVGAGRGSGVGSIVAYAIGITNIEPLQFDLLFERFLNPERVSMPDFDIDFCYERRGEVIDYVIEKYGKDRVAQIVTFGTMASKAAIKDVARVYDYPHAEINKVTKLMDSKYSIRENLGFDLHKGENVSSKEFIEAYNSDEKLKSIIDIAIKIEGLPRNTSKHAAGVIICNKVIGENVPLQRNGEDITTQFNMIECEQIGLLKMDFLGLRTLTDVKKALDYIEETTGRVIDFDKMGFEDKGVYELIGEGETDAVFQLEGNGMKKFMREYRPQSLEEIIAGISLYRPGPMSSIDSYLENRAHPDKIVYKHPKLKDTLDVTYGKMVYQEQVMRIVQDIAGYSLGQADIMRRVMSKKKASEMEKHRGYFVNGQVDADGKILIEGALRRGVSESVATELFDEMESFASYAFNKSHAAAYAALSYQTAYLKKYYLIQFLAAVLNNRITKIEEVSKYLMYAKEKQVPVLQPDINKSKSGFSVEGDSLRFGLIAIKNVGEKVIEEFIRERELNGEFKSFEDFFKRIDSQFLNKRMIECLILGGAFDCFDIPRSRLLAVYETLLEKNAKVNKKTNDGQMSMFGDVIDDSDVFVVKYPDIPEFEKKDKYSKEKEVLGVYCTGHPLEEFKDKFSIFDFNTSMIVGINVGEEDEEESSEVDDVRAELHNKDVYMGGIISGIDKVATKNGGNMLSLTIEDVFSYQSIEAIIFPNKYDKFKAVAQADAIVQIRGKISFRDDDRMPKIIVDSIETWDVNPSPETQVVLQNDKILYIKLEKEKEGYFDDICSILNWYKGGVEVRFKTADGIFAYENRVKIDEGLLSELSNLVGSKNLYIYEKKGDK